jgi:hypothetical protein
MIVMCVCVLTHSLCCLLLCYLMLCTDIEVCSTGHPFDVQTVLIIAHWNRNREPKFVIREHFFFINHYIYFKNKAVIKQKAGV